MFDHDSGDDTRPARVVALIWSHDSRAIAYTVLPAARMYVRYLDSLAARPLTQRFDGGIARVWTANDRVLLNTIKGLRRPAESEALWSVSALGGEPEWLMDMPAGTTNLITFTQDGATVAALRQDENRVWGIWTGASSGGTLQRYKPAPFESPLRANVPSLAFSPDGRQLLLMWNPIDGEQAWLLPYPPDPTRPPQRILRKLPAFNSTPTFSWMPDSRHIVISTTEPGRSASLYVADTVSEEFRLLEGGAGTSNLFAPLVAPDGTKLIVTEEYGNTDIVTLDLGTAVVTPLLDTNRAEQMPAWAAHDRLVYVTDRSGGSEIWFREPDQPDRPVVTARNFKSGVTWVFMAPELSPQLDRVAYLRVESDAAGGAVTSHLWMSSLDGSSPPVRLTSDDEKIENSGSWSPDGKWFVYTVTGADNRSMTLRKVRTLGHAASKILASGEPESDAIPTWSPDGRWILYDDVGLKLISADGADGRPRVRSASTHTVCAFARAGDLLHCLRTIPGPDASRDPGFHGRHRPRGRAGRSGECAAHHRHSRVAPHADTRRQRCDVQREPSIESIAARRGSRHRRAAVSDSCRAIARSSMRNRRSRSLGRPTPPARDLGGLRLADNDWGAGPLDSSKELRGHVHE